VAHADQVVEPPERGDDLVAAGRSETTRTAWV
jgi:hypothetical protein